VTTAPVFHADRAALTGAAQAGTGVRLDGPEGRHAALVRRLRPGERVDLTDGAGALARCTVRRAEGAALDLDMVDFVDVPAPEPRITVVQALAKGDRGETAVETMTEVGVDAIVPWSAGRSVTEWHGDRGVRSLGKWRATAAEAAKQARRAWWAEVAEPHTTAEVAKLLTAADLAIVLHESAETALTGLLSADSLPGSPPPNDPPAREIVLVVGPEGGISPDELDRFAEAGAVRCRLGPTVLRTSTAGTVAAALLLAQVGRWS
jgi:16S rRNA (uracil1498-N3)-methyltransferase